MIRVLHVVTYMGRGGLETMLMNYYRHIDRSKVQFDFLVHREFEADYDEEIKSLGGRIYHVSRLVPWSRRYKAELRRFFRTHPEYKIVHVHQDCLSSVALQCAKDCGVPVRIAHSHSSSAVKNIKYPIKLYYMKKIPRFATDLFACGKQAGDWMFSGKKYQIIRNAIDTEKYLYTTTVNKSVREELGLLGKIVIGHVGNFTPAKNHIFLLEIFKEILKKSPDSKLLLVGGGDGLITAKEKAESMGIADNVVFTGIRSDVNRLMQAMDVFVFPSLYEGLPVTMIEAQASGMQCIISDRVSKECIVTKGLVIRKRLSDSVENWANYILQKSEKTHENHIREIANAGYDISVAAKQLECFYIKKNRGREMVFLTVFTPAYNRASTLPRTYESLCDQECKEFIWLIVDDGSTDETASLVKEWQKKENGFEIQYIYKKNGGMHTAHNVAYENIHTELNVCIDSDDRMAKGAVKKIKTAWLKVRNKNYAGLIGLDADMNTGRIIGKGFPDGLKETTLGGYYASGGEGDKKLVYRTDVINSVPQYPVFEGEKYVGLVYKYTLIDQKYKLFVMNDVLCDVEYQTDGSSNTMFRQYLKNPKGFAFLRKVAMTYPTSKKRLIRDCIHYCSSSLIAGNKKYIVESPRKLLTVLCTPLGCILTSIIRKKAINN